MDTLASGFAALLIVVAGTGGYLLNRLRKLESENEAQRAKTEKDTNAKLEELTRDNQELRHKLNIAEAAAALVPDLQRQINTVCTELEALRARQSQVEGALEDKQKEAEVLLAEKAQLLEENRDLKQKLHDLEIERRALNQALMLVGDRLEKRITTEELQARAAKVAARLTPKADEPDDSELREGADNSVEESESPAQ